MSPVWAHGVESDGTAAKWTFDPWIVIPLLVLGLAYLGAGWLDAYFHLMLMPWDVAAGALIIREAGGVVTTPAGGEWTLGEPAVVAGNGKLQAQLLKALGLV